MFKRVTGTKDILAGEVSAWQRIEETARNTFHLYNYKEIRLPLIEEAALFNRSLGEETEVVKKQMFLIQREHDTFALRPEATASVARAYIENNLDKTEGFTKFYYIGPMFRAERPQKGRLRQFHHIGCEAIGSAQAELDAEIISLADKLLKNFSVSDYKIRINSLGCPEDKKRFAQILKKKLEEKTDKLCQDCQVRFNANILRILDCKNNACKEIVNKLDIGQAHLCSDCAEHFKKVTTGLDLLGVEYTIDDHLVRGLDYYTRTVFEISHQGLGAQDAIGAGGRYDDLVKDLGGPQSPAVGFAFGVERLLLVASPQSSVASQNLVYIIPLGNEAKQESIVLLNELRSQGICADTDYLAKSLKGAMRQADSLGVKYVIIIGDNELKNKAVTLKNMSTGEQKEIKRESLIKELC
ncbi:MAG: histidine--tRNA ligase [Candidatus Omnitrophica bacterium]|nr:histidine--tRNA ligase [Candidatus Omnitrophota bacterium]